MKSFYIFILSVALTIGCSRQNESSPTPTPSPLPDMQDSISYSAGIATDGNHYDTFGIPKFDTSKGTLESVYLKLTVSLYYTFNLENNEDSAFNYNIKLGRKDFISSDSLHIDIHDSVIKNYFYDLAAADGLTNSGPDYIQVNNLPVLQKYTTIDSTRDPSLFSGRGNFHFDHQSVTFGYSGNGVNYRLRGSAKDSVTLSVQYNYKKST